VVAKQERYEVGEAYRRLKGSISEWAPNYLVPR
jgi:hypothetical protein